jgi:hypothetical protein
MSVELLEEPPRVDCQSLRNNRGRVLSGLVDDLRAVGFVLAETPCVDHFRVVVDDPIFVNPGALAAGN